MVNVTLMVCHQNAIFTLTIGIRKIKEVKNNLKNVLRYAKIFYWIFFIIYNCDELFKNSEERDISIRIINYIWVTTLSNILIK